jgi:hypothetical protein
MEVLGLVVHHKGESSTLHDVIWAPWQNLLLLSFDVASEITAAARSSLWRTSWTICLEMFFAVANATGHGLSGFVFGVLTSPETFTASVLTALAFGLEEHCKFLFGSISPKHPSESAATTTLSFPEAMEFLEFASKLPNGFPGEASPSSLSVSVLEVEMLGCLFGRKTSDVHPRYRLST